MTDLEKFVSLYKDFGIDLVVVENDTGYQIKLSEEFQYDREGFTFSPKFEGWNMFYSAVDFDHNGNFIKQGFWE